MSAAARKAKKATGNDATIATNRKARFNYEIVDSVEAGIVLVGSEVKSLRDGKADLKDAYAIVRDGEMFLYSMHIGPYDYARDGGHDPQRNRKLLLHRHEIDRIASQLAEKGFALVPLRLYFKQGNVKVELGLAKGKANIDKRQTIKQREADREMERAMKYRSLD